MQPHKAAIRNQQPSETGHEQLLNGSMWPCRELLIHERICAILARNKLLGFLLEGLRVTKCNPNITLFPCVTSAEVTSFAAL